MTPERKLELLLGTARPPAGDPIFEARVMTRVAWRRAWLSAAAVLPGTTVVAALAGSLFKVGQEAAPVLGPAAMEIGGIGLVTLAALALARALGAPGLSLKA